MAVCRPSLKTVCLLRLHSFRITWTSYLTKKHIHFGNLEPRPLIFYEVIRKLVWFTQNQYTWNGIRGMLTFSKINSVYTGAFIVHLGWFWPMDVPVERNIIIWCYQGSRLFSTGMIASTFMFSPCWVFMNQLLADQLGFCAVLADTFPSAWLGMCECWNYQFHKIASDVG